MGLSMKRSVSVAAAAASIAIFACAGVATASPGGPQPAGPAPAKGVHTLGASNVSGWAVVDATGTLARGANAVAVIKLGAGTYEVQMNSKLKHCSFVGSAGDPGQGTSGFGVVTTANRAGNEKAVFVQTFNQAGTSTDTDFHLNVTCS